MCIRDKSNYYHILKTMDIAFALLFLMFYICFYIAFWNIVTSVFLEKAIIETAVDMEKLAVAKREQDDKDLIASENILYNVVKDCTNPITKDEFFKAPECPQTRACFEGRGLDMTDRSADALADTCQQFSSIQQLSQNSQFSRGCTTLQSKREGHPTSQRPQLPSSHGRHVFRFSQHPDLSHDADQDSDALADASQHFSISQVTPILRSRPSTVRRAHSEELGEVKSVPRHTFPRRVSRHLRVGMASILKLVIMVWGAVVYWLRGSGRDPQDQHRGTP